MSSLHRVQAKGELLARLPELWHPPLSQQELQEPQTPVRRTPEIHFWGFTHGHTRRVKRHAINPEGMQGAEVTGSNLQNIKISFTKQPRGHSPCRPPPHGRVVALHSKSKIFIFALGKRVSQVAPGRDGLLSLPAGLTQVNKIPVAKSLMCPLLPPRGITWQWRLLRTFPTGRGERKKSLKFPRSSLQLCSLRQQ